MKKIAFVFLLIAFISTKLLSQTIEMAYINVHWNADSCQSCCLSMEYVVCISIERMSDHALVAECCDEVGLGVNEYEFACEFPCNEYQTDEFMVYASVRKGCPPNTWCCNGKDPGETVKCNDLINHYDLTYLIIVQ
jgi:hypothetical protein